MRHKFEQYEWQNEYRTENAILNTPYDPEVVFVGTFNHGYSWNRADFFYGRGMYLWTILANLFNHDSHKLVACRTLDSIPLDEILAICKKGSIAFADVILGVPNEIPVVVLEDENELLIGKEKTKLKGYKDADLNTLGQKELLEDNVKNIIGFIKDHPSVKHVYFTFKTGGSWLDGLRQQILESIALEDIGSVFTPTGQGFGHNLAIPFDNRAASLGHCWTWNGLDNQVPVNKNGYCYLNHDWLRAKGVEPNNY